MAYSYKAKTINYQRDQLLKFLESQVRSGKVANRKQYAEYIKKMLGLLKENNVPITEPVRFESGDIVSSKQINDFFRNVTIDIEAAFKESKDTQTVSDNRLAISKKFYNSLAGDIATLKKSIAVQRTNIFGHSAIIQDTIIEPFLSAGDYILDQLKLYPKNGELRLVPYESKSVIYPDNIKRVNITVYPAENTKGGVEIISTPDRDMELNYNSGSRTMLSEGTWEMTVLTDRVPDVLFENKRYSGIVVLLDIYFESNSPINYIQFDPVGKYDLDIMYVKYRSKENSNWNYVQYGADQYGFGHAGLKGSGSNIIEFTNFIPVNPIALRFALYQDDPIKLNKTISEFAKIKEKIEYDRAYDRNFNRDTVDPKSDSGLWKNPKLETVEGNLYEELLSKVEKAVGYKQVMSIIQNTITPEHVTDEKITGKNAYTVGAHSIDIEKRTYYANQEGIYWSHDPNSENEGYKIKTNQEYGAVSPLRVTLEASHTRPAGTTIEYYITDSKGNIEIPIMDSNERTKYKEPANFVRCQFQNKLVIQTTFPVKFFGTGTLADYVTLYKNGVIVENAIPSQVEVVDGIKSSRMIEFSGIDFTESDVYSISYEPEMIASVIVWIINPTSTPGTDQCIDSYKSKVFNNAALAKKEIETHGTGCKCSVEPTYCRYDEWEHWGMSENGIGYGYTTENDVKPPVPRPVRGV